MEETHIYKHVNRTWKTLPDKGDADVYIRDPKLKQGHLGDLSKKTVLELEEVLLRQDKILNNKYLLSKLKDKGESLRRRRQEVADALKAASQREQPAINGYTHSDINATSMEWNTGTRNISNVRRKPREVLDSDDDDDEDEEDDDEHSSKMDPLRLMAYHSSSVKRPPAEQIRGETEDPSDTIAKELQKLALRDGSDPAAPPPQDFGSQRIRFMEEKLRKNGPKRDSFKPYRPTNNPKPLPEIPHHPRPTPERPTICLPQTESVKREHDYVLKEKRLMLMDRVSKPGTSRATCGPAITRYHDTNLGRHLLDLEDEEEDEEEGLVDQYLPQDD